MSKKKVVKTKKSDLKSLSFSDLYAMYMFVGSHNSSFFGKRVSIKEVIRSKLNEIEEEMLNRVFDHNPFKASSGAATAPVKKASAKVNNVVEGVDPIKVIGSFPSQDNKKFVVIDNEGYK